MPTTTPFANLITFSRGSNATVVGPNGLVQWAPNNIHTFSEQFDNAAWSKANSAVVANQNVADGTLGPELVTNGDFAGGTTTGWSNILCNMAVVGGQLELTQTGSGSPRAEQYFPTIIGRAYFVTAQARIGTAASATVTINEGSGAFTVLGSRTVTSSTLTTVSFYFVATTTSSLLQLGIPNVAGVTAYFDNISAREVTPAAAIAPDGTRTADTLLATAGTGFTPRVADTSLTTISGAVYTASLYVRPVTYTFLQIYINNQGAEWANFTLSGAGTATANGSCTAAIQALSGGWYRVSMTYTAGSTDRRPFYMLAASATATRAQSWNTTGTETALIWGAQLELGSAATTYNPTTVKNLLGFSEAFDNANWTKTDASIVTGAAANPINGLFNAQKLMENTANAVHLLGQAATLTATPYVFSIYAKAAERSWVQLRNASGTNQLAYFNLASGVAGTVGVNATASITAVGGGWYRCAIAFTAAAGSNTMHVRTATGDNVNSYTGDGNSGVFIYGAQLSDSASLDPYVPTPGAAPSSTAYYGPRFDYDPVTRAARGILIEEQRTNLLTYSEEFDNAAWADAAPTSTVTVSANATTAPDGTTSADRLTAATGGTNAMARQARTLVASTTYTGSVFIKAVSSTQSRMLLRDTTAGTNFADATITWTANVPSIAGGATGTWTVTSVGNGWYRITGTGATGATASPLVTFSLWPDTAAGTNAIFAWGAQLEAGAFATSYIPTIASTVTRSADVATITGQNFGQWYGAAAGTLVAEVQKLSPSGSATYAWELLGASSNFSMRVRLGTDSRMQSVDGGVAQVDAQLAGSVPTTASKYGMAYNLNDYAGSANGAAAATDTSASVPAISSLSIGSAAVNSLYIRSIRYIPVRAADFQLQALTT